MGPGDFQQSINMVGPQRGKVTDLGVLRIKGCPEIVIQIRDGTLERLQVRYLAG